MNSKLQWSLWGAAFGCVFPIIAFALRWAEANVAVAVGAFRTDPLLWIILTAPFFLGLFAALGGHQQDGLRTLANELEERVERRTHELKTLTTRMSLVLDSMSNALMTISLDGTLDAKPQARAQQWFKEQWQNRFVADYIAPGNKKFSTNLALGLEQLRDDILPTELALSQLPHEFETGDGRTLAIEYIPMNEVAGERRLLLVLSDVTSEVAAERFRAEQADQQAMVAHILRDPSGFQLFRKEIESLLEQAHNSTSVPLLKRVIHTIKGSSAVYGLGQLAAATRWLEDKWEETGRVELEEQQYEELRRLFAHSMGLVAPFTRQDDSATVRILRKDVLNLLNDVRRDVPRDSVVQVLHDWSMEPVKPVLDRLGAHAEQIGNRLGKQVRVVVEDQDVRLDLGAYARFFQSLVHLVRNAVDHGIEDAELRAARGKPPFGTITLRSAYDGDAIALEVSDDGGGIDWSAVDQAARKQGIACESDEERLAALFQDGVTTLKQANELSGRGVGLAAVRSSCDILSVPISLTTTAAKGTTIAFRLSRLKRSIAPDSMPFSARRRELGVGVTAAR